MITDELLNTILDEIFALTEPTINKSRRSIIGEFIKSTVNGDTPQKYLVINCNFGKDRRGALVYILSNIKLIKIEIDDKNTSSSSLSLSAIINIDKKLQDNNIAEVAIYFQNDSMGLIYAADNKKINDFFQEVDLARAKGES
ncbi:MAG: hypothetical protein WDL87_01240 [Candidatus Omnitrophota bacterium]|jgi:hypothetical protein